MFEYSFERFSPRKKKAVMAFLDTLSVQTRTMLSISGIDPKSIYVSFREGWDENLSVCLCSKKEVIGLGKLTVWENATAYLSCLVVSDKFQHKGFGSKMIKYLIACALLNGAKILTLEVRIDNKIGQACFMKNGFRMKGTSDMCYSMERKL